MPMSLHLGLRPSNVAALRIPAPSYVGFLSVASGTPGMPAGITIGSLIVGGVLRTGGTAATPDPAEGWNDWETVAFATGTAAYQAGETLTQGGVTAIIHRVHLTSGTFGAGNAAGFLTLRSRAGGNFAAGLATSPSGSATLSAAQIGSYVGNGSAIALGWKVVDGTESWGDWLQLGRRYLWAFNDADIDTRVAAATASSTSLAYPALPNMAPQSLVGVAAFGATAQTSMAGKEPTGFTSRLASAVAPIAAASDSNATLLDSFAGQTMTLDTASTIAAVSFSVRRRD